MRQLLIALLFATPLAAQDAHEIAFDALEGGTFTLGDFPGQTLLVVNTASFCAYTRQYEGLQALDDARDDVTVIGLPTDDFGGQEYDSGAEVADFCDAMFGITFPMSDIVRTRGGGAHPFFAWAEAQGGREAVPRWNFHKWIIDADGRLVASLPTRVTPGSSSIAEALDSAR
ncbi:glutathione peroxidase [Roseobacter sp. HKCCA0434]|uniref:glutathione peroxidase n=1 Tax=Roseobacter sp. HKCCA0434 TaxID=3079297 RepID=UPI002905D7EB|nr:glutathione peroxidase [Roseobacter sp. HKCCA0434]